MTKKIISKTNNKINKDELIKAMATVKLRAEKQPDFADSIHSFVPIIDLELLSTPNTQIIYGRNGTGKTHLLKAFHEHCEINFESQKNLPIYIDCKDLDLGNASPISPDELVIRFYRRFLGKIVDRLKVFSDKVITFSFLEKVFGGDGKNRKKKIEEYIEHTNSILNMEQVEELVKDHVRKIKFEQEGAAKSEGRVYTKSGISLTTASSEVNASIGTSVSDVQTDTETIELIYKGLSVIDYSAVRDNLENIIEQCGATSVILLVDEWSTINLNLQPIFAEMIRKTLAISDKVFIKIVSLKYYTRMSAMLIHPQRIGLQLGIDINVLADLDELLNFDINKQRITDILTLIAHKHLLTSIKRLTKISAQKFAEYMINELFEDVDTYQEIIRSSEGNPRDFLNILSGCCITVKFSSGKKITKRLAIGVAINHFLSNKLPEIKTLPDTNNLFDKLFHRVVKNKHKLFLISARVAETNIHIQELWHHRFIHSINPSYVVLDQNMEAREYAVYSMDYGKLLTLKVNERGEAMINIFQRTASIAASIIQTDLMGTVMDRTLALMLENPTIRGSIKNMIGTQFVKHEGVEVAELSNVEYLISHCIVDDLLEVS